MDEVVPVWSLFLTPIQQILAVGLAQESSSHAVNLQRLSHLKFHNQVGKFCKIP